MGVYAVWLADAARMTGYPVVEINGWRGRGHGAFRVIEGSACHHTADGAGEYPSLGVVTNGRAGLAGPLANYGLGRSGTIYVIAAGVGWHAGASTWAGFRDLNDEFIGIEAESRGTVNDWTPEQRDCYPRLNAAICHYIRRGADRVAGHKEICLPRGRKIDPAFWDMNDTRAKVAWMLADPGARIPRGGAAPSAQPMTNEELTDMIIGQDQADGRLYLISGNTKLELPAGGSASNSPGRGNVYADECLRMIQAAYPSGPKPDLVALNHDIVSRMPNVLNMVDGSAPKDVTRTEPGEQAKSLPK